MDDVTYGWTAEDYDWRSRAACVGYADLFFPQPDLTHVRAAIAICHTCTVIRECADYADEAGEKRGIWGGRNRGAKVKVSGPQS